MEQIQKIEMKGVTRRFAATTALYDFNLEIDKNMFVSLLGPSGCGKSTALNCLAGLLELSEGEIRVNGKPIQQLPAEKRGFGMVFQNYALFPHLTVARNVAYGLEIRGVAKAERERRVKKALSIVHLEDFEKRYPAQLSGGQQQRLAIARTIVLEPGLLLLDEPLSNLDTKLRNEMRIEIKRLHDKLGLTTVYVTHDQSEAMSLSDLVVVMRLGKIEQVGIPQEIYNFPVSLYVADFMGYSNRLLVELGERVSDKWQVLTQTGESLLATTTVKNTSDWATGQQLLACFRPDDTLMGIPDAQNRLQGQVQLVEYLGKSFEALVRLPGESEGQILAHCHEQVEVGSTLDFTISPDRLLLFPVEQEKELKASKSDTLETPTTLKGRN